MGSLRDVRNERIGRITARLASRLASWSQTIGQSAEDVEDGLEAARQILEAAERVLAADEAGEDPRAAIGCLRRAVERSDLHSLVDAAPAAIERQERAAAQIAAAAAALSEQSSNEVAPFDLNQAVRCAATLAEPQIAGVAQLHLDLAELPTMLCASGDFVHAILELLLDAGRALEASGCGGERAGHVAVRTRASGHTVELSITEGCAASATSPPQRRGLAIARSVVVDAHGGELALGQTAAGGARVILRFPSVPQAA